MRTLKLNIVLMGLILFFGACGSKKVQSEYELKYGDAGKMGLSQKEAEGRFSHIKNLSYILEFRFDETSDEFRGRAVIRFKGLQKADWKPEHAFLDFTAAKIQSARINGTLLPTEANNGYRLYFDPSLIINGLNQIEIEYTHPYNTDGMGLHRFKDPVDSKVYLYSNFEPFHANRLFPGFDQPDLKATYSLQVLAPEQWKVIANVRESRVEKSSEETGMKLWHFSQDKKYSTYLFALHAGPYQEWRSQAGSIPLRLFARQSLAKDVKPEEWFLVTRHGLSFFNRKFGVPYPFRKYDQIIVPEFNGGAMENIAAITFTERYVYRSKVTGKMRLRRANVILHEMAHMWFGDLVTMKWWNDLWLNESFATFAASWAADSMQQALGVHEPWLATTAGSKSAAYYEDQLVTTHPIEVPVRHTSIASTIFDGISYGKGAAVLKQLYFSLGEEAFLAGLRQYFKKFAYKNATRADFMQTLQSAAAKDLSQWQKLWLQTSGVNQVQADWTCEDGKVKEMKVLQRSLAAPAKTLQPDVLRPHRMRASFYQWNDAQALWRLLGETLVDYSTESTLIASQVSKPCPDLVVLNAKDLDYVRVAWNEKSLEWLRRELSKLPNPIDRQIVWQSLWEGVIEGSFGAENFLTFVMNHLREEKEEEILSWVLTVVAKPALNSASVLRYLPSEKRLEWQPQLEALYLDLLKKMKPGSDVQLALFQNFIWFAQADASKKWILDLYEGREILNGFVVDQDRRWELVMALSRTGEPQAMAKVEQELTRDPSDLGIKNAFMAEALWPQPEQKKRWYGLFFSSPADGQGSPALTAMLKDKRPSVSKLRDMMGVFYANGQQAWVATNELSYTSDLAKLIDAKASEVHLANVSAMLFPTQCDTAIRDKADGFLHSISEDAPSIVVKNLKIRVQEIERCIRAQGLSKHDSSQ